MGVATAWAYCQSRDSILTILASAFLTSFLLVNIQLPTPFRSRFRHVTDRQTDRRTDRHWPSMHYAHTLWGRGLTGAKLCGLYFISKDANLEKLAVTGYARTNEPSRLEIPKRAHENTDRHVCCSSAESCRTLRIIGSTCLTTRRGRCGKNVA